MDTKAKDLLRFQINRNIVVLYKRFLNTLEDVRNDHNIMLNKLDIALPREYNNTLNNVDYFSDDKYDYWRKRILDQGNESIRELERLIEQFNVDLK